jgi:hypothetical protein
LRWCDFLARHTSPCCREAAISILNCMAYLESRNTITTKTYGPASRAPRGSYRVVYLTQPGSRARSVKPTAPCQILALRSRQSVYHLARSWLSFVSFHSAPARGYPQTEYLPPWPTMKGHTRELLTSDIVSRIFSFESGMQDFLHQERIEQHLENVASLPEGN